MKLEHPVFLVGIALLTSCSIVTTPAPLGETPLKITNDQWNGVWVVETDKENLDADFPSPPTVFMKVANAEKGELQVLMVDIDTADMKARNLRVAVRKIGAEQVGSTLDPDTKRWLPFLIERPRENRIVIRFLSAVGIQKILGIDLPKDNSGELTAEHAAQLADWLSKLPAGKEKRRVAMDLLTDEDEDRMVLYRLQAKKPK